MKRKLPNDFSKIETCNDNALNKKIKFSHYEENICDDSNNKKIETVVYSGRELMYRLLVDYIFDLFKAQNDSVDYKDRSIFLCKKFGAQKRILMCDQCNQDYWANNGDENDPNENESAKRYFCFDLNNKKEYNEYNLKRETFRVDSNHDFICENCVEILIANDEIEICENCRIIYNKDEFNDMYREYVHLKNNKEFKDIDKIVNLDYVLNYTDNSDDDENNSDDLDESDIESDIDFNHDISNDSDITNKYDDDDDDNDDDDDSRSEDIEMLIENGEYPKQDLCMNCVIRILNKLKKQQNIK